MLRKSKRLLDRSASANSDSVENEDPGGGVHYNYFSIYSFLRYILYFVVSQASSTGRHGSTDCTVPGAASLADYKVKYISHK